MPKETNKRTEAARVLARRWLSEMYPDEFADLFHQAKHEYLVAHQHDHTHDDKKVAR